MHVLPKILVQFPRLLRGHVRLCDEKKFKHIDMIVSNVVLFIIWMAHSLRFLKEEFVDSYKWLEVLVIFLAERVTKATYISACLR